MSNAIVELASRLGKAIADSNEAKKLRDLRRQVNADKELSQALQAFHDHADKIGALEQENKPVEVSEKHRLQELHDKLVGSDLFKKFTAAQVDYVDLMRRVNEALGKQLGEEEEAVS